MQIGQTSFSSSATVFLLLIIAALAQSDNMKGNAAASESPIRQSQSLCAGEQEYVRKRKQVVLESLCRLGINCTEDSIPHITFLASGGGQRAAVGMVGSLYQMEKDDLLDTLLYLGGVSGSTWSMSSVYSDPEWSTNIDGAVSSLSGPGVELVEALAWLDKRAKEEHFSLSDVWGVLTSVGIMKQMNLRNLSDEAGRNVSNPYPIYCAIEKHCFSNGPIEGKWFEVSPHEAGFTELGFFIETSLLGSRFEGGQLQERMPEMDMVQLQGVLGSAIAHEETIRGFIPPWLDVSGPVDHTADEYLRVYNALDKLVAMISLFMKDPDAVSNMERLQKMLDDKVNHNESTWRETKTTEERKILVQRWNQELVAEVEKWSQSLEEGAFKSQVSLLINRIIPLILKWEWGTTANFLYKHQDLSIPPCLRSEERFHLIDGGLLINVAYPSFLGDRRDIDLFIAPEYSAGNMFETLTLARDYAATVQKPFPEIPDEVVEERDWPRDCYVFEGKGNEPTIVYMPLFNRNNCKDADEFKDKMDKFSTFQRPYSQEKIDFVLETAKENMKNNKETLLREINKAVLRRHNRRMCQVSHSCGIL